VDAKVLETQNKTALFRATKFTKDYNEIRFFIVKLTYFVYCLDNQSSTLREKSLKFKNKTHERKLNIRQRTDEGLA
jgi:hypothetical protein